MNSMMQHIGIVGDSDEEMYTKGNLNANISTQTCTPASVEETIVREDSSANENEEMYRQNTAMSPTKLTTNGTMTRSPRLNCKAENFVVIAPKVQNGLLTAEGDI